MRLAAMLVIVAACGSASHDTVRSYGHGAEPVVCRDEACRMIEACLADLRAETLTFYQASARILKLGERAVPTLLRELDTESVLHVRVAAYVLTALGHVEKVDAWCRTLGRDRDGRDLACSPR